MKESDLLLRDALQGSGGCKIRHWSGSQRPPQKSAALLSKIIKTLKIYVIIEQHVQSITNRKQERQKKNNGKPKVNRKQENTKLSAKRNKQAKKYAASKQTAAERQTANKQNGKKQTASNKSN